MCLSWWLNLWTLSSIDGQYLGPTPLTSPENIGLLCMFSSIIFLVKDEVYVVWQGMFFGLNFSVPYEKGMDFLSPGAKLKLFHSTVLASSLGGVPVLSLPDLKPMRKSDSVIPSAAFSPILPALIFFCPICNNPFKKVPHVRMVAEHPILEPSLSITATTLLLATSTSTTSPFIKLMF